MGWSDFRKSNTENTASRGSGSGRRFDPFAARVLYVTPGEEFEVIICDHDPYARAIHWLDVPHECTSEHPMFEGKCVFCVDANRIEAENERLEAQGQQAVQYKHYRRVQWALPTIDLRMFHFVDDPKKPGKFTVAPCAVLAKKVPEGMGSFCPHCKDKDPWKSERRFLGTRRFEVDGELWKSIKDADVRARGTCLYSYPNGGTCFGGTFLASLICSECGHEYMDSNTIHGSKEGLKNAGIFAERTQKCAECGTEGKPYAQYLCTNAQKRAKGGVPEHECQPATLVNGLVHIACSGTPRGDSVVRKYTINPLTQKDPVDTLVADWDFSAEAAQAMVRGENINYASVYLPERKDPKDKNFLKGDVFQQDAYVAAVLQAQSEALGIPNPFTGKDTTTNRPFGKGGGARRAYTPEGDDNNESGGEEARRD